jgi:putative copper export protein
MNISIAGVIIGIVAFICSFMAIGAVGFRFVVLRGDAAAEPAIAERAARRAAIYGVIGYVITSLMYVAFDLAPEAQKKGISLLSVVTSGTQTTVETICIVLGIIGFLLAVSRVGAGWFLAAIGAIGEPLASLLSGWNRAINPIHVLAGGLWIGTLFILLMAGFTTVLRSDLDAVRRGELAASMVHRFSPLALCAFALLAFTGVNTAWRHLKVLSNLWSTPYGYTLIAKLCVVLVVVALGAWNWRKQRPLLGTESAAAVLRRSATAEVIAATVVLAITSVLVSLPSPK